jgi:hypothetical protein
MSRSFSGQPTAREAPMKIEFEKTQLFGKKLATDKIFAFYFDDFQLRTLESRPHPF